MFATNTDLQKYAPEVFDQGVNDWSSELADAQHDVENQIQFKWWNKAYSRQNWDPANLTETQWTKATVYRSLSAYILPRLSTFRPEGDPFREQLMFYKERYQEEMDTQFGMGVEYDLDEDGTTTDIEVFENSQTRLYR